MGSIDDGPIQLDPIVFHLPHPAILDYGAMSGALHEDTPLLLGVDVERLDDRRMCAIGRFPAMGRKKTLLCKELDSFDRRDTTTPHCLHQGGVVLLSLIRIRHCEFDDRLVKSIARSEVTSDLRRVARASMRTS